MYLSAILDSPLRGCDVIFNHILASLRFASTEERVTRSSKQMKCGWDNLIAGIFYLFLFIFNKEISRTGEANSTYYCCCHQFSSTTRDSDSLVRPAHDRKLRLCS